MDSKDTIDNTTINTINNTINNIDNTHYSSEKLETLVDVLWYERDISMHFINETIMSFYWRNS